MPKFSVGEIVIIVNGATTYQSLVKYYGQEVEVVVNMGADFDRKCYPGKNYYQIAASDGKSMFVEEDYLRKKRPPKRAIDEIVKWEDTPWVPDCLIEETAKELID